MAGTQQRGQRPRTPYADRVDMKLRVTRAFHRAFMKRAERLGMTQQAALLEAVRQWEERRS